MKSKRVTAVSIPYLLWIGLFTIVPLAIVAYYALTDTTGAFTLQHISDVSKYASVIFRSIYLAAISTIICLVIAYPLAFIISRMPAHKQKLALMLVMLPMWMNFLLRTYALMTLLENTGIINSLLGLIGIGPFKMINTAGAVVLGMVYNYLPFMILPLYSVMVKIDNSLIQAGQDLGADSKDIFSKIVLPLSMPGVMSGVTMVFVPSISTFIISRMLGGGSNMMIGDLIELQFLGNTYNPNLGSAISLGLMVLILLCMSGLNQFDDEDKEGMII